MTAVETRVVVGGRGGELLRRGAMATLAFYLAPVALVVLLIGALGLACCAALRLVVGGPGRPGDGRSRRHGPARAIGATHLRAASRRHSPSR